MALGNVRRNVWKSGGFGGAEGVTIVMRRRMISAARTVSRVMSRVLHASCAIGPVALGVLLGIPTAGHAGELRFYTWADYIAPAVIAKFEREHGERITIVPLHSDSEIAMGLLPGQTGYDLSTPVDFQVPALIRAGALERIDGPGLEHYSTIERPWRALPYDRYNDYSVPFLWGTISFVVDTAVFGGDIDTYSVLFNPPDALKGRISLLYGTADAIRMGLAYLGLPVCSGDPAHIGRVLDLFRPLRNPALITTISTAIPVLAGDRAAAGLAWNGDALRARLKKPSLRYAYPREGTFFWSDTLVVPKGAPNRAAALAFIDFMLRPENAALQSNFAHYANPVRGSDAFMDQDIIEAPEVIMPPNVSIDFRQFCEGDIVHMYASVWDAFLEEGRK